MTYETFNFLLQFNKENIRKKSVIQNFNFKESQETLTVETHIFKNIKSLILLDNFFFGHCSKQTAINP